MNFKNEKDKMLFFELHIALQMILTDITNYAKEKHDIDIVITETVTTPEIDKKLKRTSKAHQHKIAADIRTKNVNVFKLKDIVDYINSKPEWKKYHYERLSGGKILAYFHIGHLHVALHSRFAIK